MESDYHTFKKKVKNEFDNLIILASIKLLNLFGFKCYLPKIQKFPKNNLVKYIEYQMYLQKEQEKKINLNYYPEIKKYYAHNIKQTNIIGNDIKKYLKI